MKYGLELAWCHVFQKLEEFILRVINQFGALDHQLSEGEVPAKHCAHKAALVYPFDCLNINKLW